MGQLRIWNLLIFEPFTTWNSRVRTVHPKKELSATNNWELDNFFPKLICGRWLFAFAAAAAADLSSSVVWLITLVVYYQSQWLIIILFGWYWFEIKNNESSYGRLSAILDEIQQQQMIFNYSKWYSFDVNDIHLQQIFYPVNQYSSKKELYHSCWLITRDDNQPLGMKLNHW
jgi:hypothetical protein